LFERLDPSAAVAELLHRERKMENLQNALRLWCLLI
jgi:hypothetical protein